MFKLRRWLKFCLLLMLLVGNQQHVAAADVRLFTFPIPLLVENDRKGVLIDLMMELQSRTELQIEITVLPTARGVRMFQQGEADGVFPVTQSMVGMSLVRTVPIAFKRDIAFVRTDTELPTSLDNFNNKVIGLTRGYPYSQNILNIQGATYAEGVSDLANILKLSRGRTDVFIVEQFSGYKALEDSKVTNVIAASEFPLSNAEVFIAFQDNPRGRELNALFNKALFEMKEDGVFLVILHPIRDMFNEQ